MNAAQLINQTSGEVDYYTPIPIIEAARNVMGSIDSDPASSEFGNTRVKAVRFGVAPKMLEVGKIGDLPVLKMENLGSLEWRSNHAEIVWSGHVWMNHPFQKTENPCAPDCGNKTCITRGYHVADGTPGNEAWIGRLVNFYESRITTQACCITYACTSEKWFTPLLRRPQCFLVPRTNYDLADGTTKKGVTKGSVVTYFGNNPLRFASVFENHGIVHYPANGFAVK